MSFWIVVILNLIAFASTEERPGQISYPGNRETIRCYVGTNTGIQGTTICPSWSNGCVKRTICKETLYSALQKTRHFVSICSKSTLFKIS